MTERVTLFADEDMQRPVAEVAFGEELSCIGMGDTVSVLSYEGEFVFAETKYLKDEAHNGSVVFMDPEHPTMRVTANNINLRTYTDASSGDNRIAMLAKDTVVSVTGVSKNGNWVRIAYTPEGASEARTVYARWKLDITSYLEYVTEG